MRYHLSCRTNLLCQRRNRGQDVLNIIQSETVLHTALGCIVLIWNVLGPRKQNSSSKANSSGTKRNLSSSVVRITLNVLNIIQSETVLHTALGCIVLISAKIRQSLEDWAFEELPDSWAICCLGELCDYGNCLNVDTVSISDSAWILDLEDIEKDSGVVHMVKKTAAFSRGRLLVIIGSE